MNEGVFFMILNEYCHYSFILRSFLEISSSITKRKSPFHNLIKRAFYKNKLSRETIFYLL